MKKDSNNYVENKDIFRRNPLRYNETWSADPISLDDFIVTHHDLQGEVTLKEFLKMDSIGEVSRESILYDIFDKWVEVYEEKLKPTIKIGTFRFLNQGDFVNWRQINLQEEKTYWGAEPAADILTNYLKPQELTIYTTETRNELIKNYKLIPDETGNVKAYYKFWNDNDNHKQIVPPLLIYADLININDRRCLETAKKIYDAYLQNKL